MLTDIIRLVLGNQQIMVLKQDGSAWSTAINLRGDNSPGDLDPKFMQMIERKWWGRYNCRYWL